MLRGTIRDHDHAQAPDDARFFACEEDLSHESAGCPAAGGGGVGAEPLTGVGAIAGG